MSIFIAFVKPCIKGVFHKSAKKVRYTLFLFQIMCATVTNLDYVGLKFS